MFHTDNDFSELLVSKEKELKELQARQIHFQKTTLQETRKQLQEMHRKFNKLKEDFSYNLRVLGERDGELEHYDTLFTQLKMVENAKQAEISDLRIQVDKLQQAVAQETKKQVVLQYQYQQKLKEHQLQLDQFHSCKESVLNRYREDYETMKHQLERKLQEVEGELALQRQELLMEFDAEMKRREHEFRQRADEMNNLVLSHELKVKLLTKELEVLKEVGVKATEALKVAEETNLELEKELTCKNWEIKDHAAVKDAQIQALENKLESVQLNWKKEKETFEIKRAAIDHVAREKDAIIASLKEAHTEQKHTLENQIQELQTHKETLEMELHRAERKHSDFLREKETIIEKLKQELDALEKSWISQVAQFSRETVSKDLKIQAMQEEEVKLRAQQTSLLQDIERYKQQLSLAAEREETLERAKVQIELDWQRRHENIERNQYQKSETLIHNLSAARDQLTAELQEKTEKLHEVEVILSAVKLERDQAVQELQKHDLLTDGAKQDILNDNVGAVEGGFPSTEIHRLQEQNSSLRAAVAEMRREMETLTVQTPSIDDSKMKIQDVTRTDAAAIYFSPGYVQCLQEEIRTLKKKCFTLNKQLESASKFPRKVSSLSTSSCNKYTQTSQQDYIFSANNDTLRSDEIVTETLQVGVPKMDSTGTQQRKVNAGTKRIQESSVHCRQQLLDVEAGDGSLQVAGNHAQMIYMMQSTLKETSRKICSLSKEKQQLIEIVNRLRAELGAASKKGSDDSKSSKHFQGHIFPGALHPKELAREAKHRLLAVERLQYQLTTQELQCAQRKHTLGKRSVVQNFSNENASSSTSSNEEVEVPVKKLENESLSQPQQDLLSSSGALSSVQDIWQTLEMGSSPSSLSPWSNNIQERSEGIHENDMTEYCQEKANAGYLQRAPAATLTVKGTKFDVKSKTAPSKPSCNQPRKPRTSQQIARIRNYNVKD